MDSIRSGTSQHNIPVSRRNLVSFYLMGVSNDHEARFQCLITKVREISHCEDELPNYIKQELFQFIYQLKGGARNKKRFENKYSNWLDTSINIYALKTAVLYLKWYPWYNMPTTIHRILIHGHIIIDSEPEEAQESKNKDIKKYREGFTRKFSRKQTMEDLFHQLLISSDPHIAGLRKLQKTNKSYPHDVIILLREPQVII